MYTAISGANSILIIKISKEKLHINHGSNLNSFPRKLLLVVTLHYYFVYTKMGLNSLVKATGNLITPIEIKIIKFSIR